MRLPGNRAAGLGVGGLATIIDKMCHRRDVADKGVVAVLSVEGV
jgi:hypothetical protein